MERWNSNAITFTTKCMQVSVVIPPVLLRTNTALSNASASSTFVRRIDCSTTLHAEGSANDTKCLYTYYLSRRSLGCRFYLISVSWEKCRVPRGAHPFFWTSSFTAPRLNWLLKVTLWRWGGCRIALVKQNSHRWCMVPPQPWIPLSWPAVLTHELL